MSVSFIVRGTPRGKGRPRAFPRVVWRDGEPEAVVTISTPSETVEAERLVRNAFRSAHPNHTPYTGPVMLNFTAVFEVPKSWPRRMKEAARTGVVYHTSVPDKDNIEKLVVDALNGIAFMDDAQVQGGGIKRYGSPERVIVTLTPIETDSAVTPAQKRRDAAMAVADPARSVKALPLFSGII